MISSTFSRCPDARHYDGVLQRRDETVAGTTGSTTILDARLDVRIWSVSEGATQQQSGGVVLATGASARPVLKTWVELHQHEYLANRERQIVRMQFRSFADYSSAKEKNYTLIIRKEM